MYKLKKGVEQKKAWGIIVILFLAMGFFSILGFYDKYYYGSNDKINDVTGNVIRPAEGIAGAISSLVKDSEVMAYILSFIMLFCLFFVLVEQTHVFKENKRAGAVFSIAATLLAVIFTDLVEWIKYLVSYGFWIMVAIFFLLIFFTLYLFAHKKVSAGIGEIAGVAAGRERARGDYLEGRGGYLDKRTAYLGKEGDYLSQKKLEASKLSMINQLKPSIKEIGPIFQKLNQDATTVGIRTDRRINKLFNDLRKVIQLFQAYINKGDTKNAVQTHTQIRALIGMLDGEIKRVSKK